MFIINHKRILVKNILFFVFSIHSLLSRIDRNKVYQIESNNKKKIINEDPIVVVQERNLIYDEAKNIEHENKTKLNIQEHHHQSNTLHKNEIIQENIEEIKNHVIRHEENIQSILQKEGIFKAISYIKKNTNKEKKFVSALINETGSVLYSSYTNDDTKNNIPFNNINEIFEIPHETWKVHLFNEILFYTHIKKIVLNHKTFFLLSGYVTHDPIIFNEYIENHIENLIKNNSFKTIEDMFLNHNIGIIPFHDFSISLLNEEKFNLVIDNFSVLTEEIKKKFITNDYMTTTIIDENEIVKTITKKKLKIENKNYFLFSISLNDTNNLIMNKYIDKQKNNYLQQNNIENIIYEIEKHNQAIDKKIIHHSLIDCEKKQLLSQETKASLNNKFIDKIIDSAKKKNHCLTLYDSDNMTIHYIYISVFFIDDKEYILCTSLYAPYVMREAFKIEKKIELLFKSHSLETLHELLINDSFFQKKNIHIGIFAQGGICICTNNNYIHKRWEKIDSKLPYSLIEKNLKKNNENQIVLNTVNFPYGNQLFLSNYFETEIPYTTITKNKNKKENNKKIKIFALISF